MEVISKPFPKIYSVLLVTKSKFEQVFLVDGFTSRAKKGAYPTFVAVAPGCEGSAQFLQIMEILLSPNLSPQNSAVSYR